MELLIYLAMGLLLYFAIVFPQQRRTKQHNQLLASLSEGDEVLTNAGVYGFVNAIDDNVIWLDVADGVELRIAKNAVASKVTQPSSDDEESNA